MVILWSLAPFFIFITLTVHKEPVAPWMKVFATCFLGIISLLTIALVVLPYFTSYSLDPVNLTIKIGPFSKKNPDRRDHRGFPDVESVVGAGMVAGPIKNSLLLLPVWRADITC